VTVDYAAGATVEQLKPSNRNIHVVQMYDILDAIGRGEAQIGLLYKIAEFQTYNGAYVARGTMLRQQSEWPELEAEMPGCRFEVKGVKTGERASELWVGVVRE
jgi:hypothetical protein